MYISEDVNCVAVAKRQEASVYLLAATVSSVISHNYGGSAQISSHMTSVRRPLSRFTAGNPEPRGRRRFSVALPSSCSVHGLGSVLCDDKDDGKMAKLVFIGTTVSVTFRAIELNCIDTGWVVG